MYMKKIPYDIILVSLLQIISCNSAHNVGLLLFDFLNPGIGG